MTKISTKRDDPFRMLMAYQNMLIGTERIIDILKIGEQFDPYKICEDFWPYIQNMLSDVQGCLFFSLTDVKDPDPFQFYFQNKCESYMNQWKDLSSEHQNNILNIVLQVFQDDKREVALWNYDKDTEIFVKNSQNKIAMSISWLCDLPSDITFFMLLIRNEEKNPLLCHEVQAIKVISRIIGIHLKNTFSYQSLQMNLQERFDDTAEKN
jgi:hypothetical protein